MDWKQQMHEIVESSSLVPTFEQWLDATGYREYARALCTGNINMQATGLNALYDYYQTEMRKRRRA